MSLRVEPRKFFFVILYYNLIFLFVLIFPYRSFRCRIIFLFLDKTHRRFVHHGFDLPEIQLAGLLIHLALHHIAASGIFSFICRRDGRLNDIQNFIRIQSLLIRNLLQRFC